MSKPYPERNGKRAFVTGITGQDGSYLAELLIEKGYEVFGMVRRSSSPGGCYRIEHLLENRSSEDARLQLVFGDLADGSSLDALVEAIRPDEVYNLASQSNVGKSFESPEYTLDVTGQGCVRVLEAIHKAKLDCRFVQAASSEMYGRAAETPQTERTPFNPRSPYAQAKLTAFTATREFRESCGMFAANGIMFGHESPRRSESFVTRKITLAVARIQAGTQDCLYLGNLAANRDWGHAADYVDAMWRMLQAPAADDYVIATGELHSVREFCEVAFELAEMPIEWHGSGLDEVGIDRAGIVRVRIDPRFLRPVDVDVTLGDASYAREKLGWRPTVSFAQLVQTMLEADIKLVSDTQQ
jgi:GDPmannose 4,6-dehydratase